MAFNCCRYPTPSRSRRISFPPRSRLRIIRASFRRDRASIRSRTERRSSHTTGPRGRIAIVASRNSSIHFSRTFPSFKRRLVIPNGRRSIWRRNCPVGSALTRRKMAAATPTTVGRATHDQFEQFLAARTVTSRVVVTDQERDQLFQDFLTWSQLHRSEAGAR